MQRRVYQAYAGPVLANTPELPVTLPNFGCESNWVRRDRPWGIRAESPFPFAALYNPAATVLVSAFLPTEHRPSRWPQRFTIPPTSEQPYSWGTGVIVPPATVDADPSVFLSFDHVTQIDLECRHVTQIDLACEHVTQINLGGEYGD